LFSAQPGAQERRMQQMRERAAGGTPPPPPPVPARDTPPEPARVTIPLPPPPAPRAAPEGAVVPAQVLPELRNAEEVARALVANYPPLLRDAGIGGTATVWLFIGEDGRVLRTQMARSSGHEALDNAALNVAALMRFRPFVRAGQPGTGWVELPVVFGGAAAERPAGAGGAGDAVRLSPLAVPARQGDAAAAAQAQRDPRAVAPAASAAPAAQPTFTPMTQRPELQNVLDVQRALVRSYPPELRDAGISGTPVLWVFVDEQGVVQRLQLSRTSGHDALDRAALEVATMMRFSPAMNRDRVVAVWIEIPVVFTARL
jgi:periplasmic protein TonB